MLLNGVVGGKENERSGETALYIGGKGNERSEERGAGRERMGTKERARRSEKWNCDEGTSVVFSLFVL